MLLYGFGSQKELISHSFADAYISYNHFVTADNGMMYDGFNKRRYSGNNFEKYMEKNYLQIHKNIESIKYQTKLSEVNLARWEAVKEKQGQLEDIHPHQVLVAAM